jgi:16S rRNA pseudouridine516 synthase
MSRLPLDRILQTQGFGTRRECRTMIAAGFVRVAGEPVVEYDTAFETANLSFSVHDTPWVWREKVYLALHKPPGYECSRRPSHHAGVMALLPVEFARRGVQAVGRLDYDSTGLLLLSDDGAFIHAMTSPRRHVPKLYVATTAEPVTPELIARLRQGVKLHDEPAMLRASARQLGDRELEMILERGKYHQVRRMLAAAGNHCAALCRIATGGLTLESLGLAVGEWCHIDPAQVAEFAA